MHTAHLLPGLVAVLRLGSAAPVLAQPPPSAIAPAPAAPTPPAGSAGTADSDGPGRDGLFVTASLGGAPGGYDNDLQLGWMLAPWLGMLVSVGGYTGGTISLPDGRQDLLDVSIEGVGVRLGGGLGFAEVQIASLTTTSACEDDDPCIHREAVAAILGAGLELVQTRHFGLHLRAQFVIERHDVVPLIQLGLGFYL